MNTFIDNINNIFGSYLKKHEFKQNDIHYSQTDFGNAFISYTCEMFKIKIIKNRGQVFLDLSSKYENDWYDIYKIVEYLEGYKDKDLIQVHYENIDDIEKREIRQLTDLLYMLVKYELQIKNFFNHDNYTKIKENFKEFCTEKVIKRLNIK